VGSRSGAGGRLRLVRSERLALGYGDARIRAESGRELTNVIERRQQVCRVDAKEEVADSGMASAAPVGEAS
jgi:hypothetical protein